MEFGEIVFYGGVLGVVLAFVVGIVVAFGVGVSAPKLAFYPLLGVLLFFTDTHWGLKDAGAPNVYSRGVGQLHFSLLNIYLWGLALVLAVTYMFRDGPRQRCNLYKYLFAFNVFFAGHILAAVLLDVPLFDALSYRGVLNVLNMSVMIYIMLHLFDNEHDLRRLIDIFAVCALARGIFGVVRFLFFGGDPANVYATVEKLDVTLTFFDVNDSLIAVIAGFYSAWRLSFDWKLIRIGERVFYAIVCSVELFVVVFSYRRTNLGGLALAAAFFVILQPGLRRLWYAVGAAVVTVPAVIVILLYRLEKVGSKSVGLESLFHDLFSKRGEGSVGRFAELEMAFDTIRDHWLLGAGTWAQYDGRGLDFHGGVYDFVHSGVVHIWLKTGLVGLFIVMGMAGAYAVFVNANRFAVRPDLRGFYEAGFAGVLFMIPDYLMGTPVIEFRTMLLTGFAIAVPYCVYFSYAHSNWTRDARAYI
jgi:hypothetical protein